MNKTGSVRDVLLIIVVLFSLGLCMFVLNFVVNTSVNNLLSISTINSSNSTVTAFTSLQDTAQRFDYLMFGLFVGLVLALLITSWIVGGHPIFMFIYFIVVMIGVVASTLLSNAWETVTQASVFGSTINNFPILNHIISNFAVYAAVIGVFGLIIMFAKPYIIRGEGY